MRSCTLLLAASWAPVVLAQTDVAVPPSSAPARPAAVAGESPSTPGEFWVRVTGDEVNLRSRADVNSLPVAQVNRGTYLRVTGGEPGWHRVVPPPGVFSLAKAEFVKLRSETEGEVAVDSGTLRIRVGSRVREVDPLTAEVQARLENGAPLRILGRSGEWLKVAPPPGVFVYLATDYAERVPDDSVERTAAGEPLVRYSVPGESAALVRVEPQEPATRPALDMSGPWGRRLTEIERAIDAQAARPIAQRDWPPILEELTAVAEQQAEPQVARRAAAWKRELGHRAEAEKAIVEARQIAERQRRDRQRAVEEMERIRRAAEQPGARGSFDATGQLLPSFELEAGEHGLRYKLQDPLTREVRAYVEFPDALGIDVSACVGKYVGVQAERYLDARHEVTVLRVTALTVLTPGPERPVPQPARKSERRRL